jgi:cholesterol oxidase
MPTASEEAFDVVVVGSGFGGSVCACRAAEADPRRTVLVLERGQPYPPGSFARTPTQMRQAFWAPHKGRHGLFEYWRFSDLRMVCASGLGGGSLIYANVMLRKEEDTFVKEALAAGGRESWPITLADLQRHYANVENMQQPQVYPTQTEPYARTPKTRAMVDAAGALALNAEHPPLAVLFAPTRDGEPAPGVPVSSDDLHGRPRSTCRLCGECDVGCNYGAKNTLDFTYLSAAKKAGAALRTCCEVETIRPLPGREGGYEVGYRQHLAARDGHPADLLDPTDEATRTVRATHVILAAGAVGSTRLLLANRRHLRKLSDALGTRVSANGDALALLRDARDGTQRRHLDPSFGPVITTSITVPANRSPSGRGYRIQDGGAPVLADWLWEGLEVPKLPWRLRSEIAAAIRGALTGRRDTNLSAMLAEAFTDRSAALMPLLVNGRDVPDGTYVLNGGRLDLTWSSASSSDYYAGVEQSFGDLAEALGGRIRMPPWRWINRSMTIHPLGGCPMADDPRSGVVDSWGRVYGHPGLYVADGAAMPGPVGVNPSFTIAAFADRVSDGLLDPARAGAS